MNANSAAVQKSCACMCLLFICIFIIMKFIYLFMLFIHATCLRFFIFIRRCLIICLPKFLRCIDSLSFKFGVLFLSTPVTFFFASTLSVHFAMLYLWTPCGSYLFVCGLAQFRGWHFFQIEFKYRCCTVHFTLALIGVFQEQDGRDGTNQAGDQNTRPHTMLQCTMHLRLAPLHLRASLSRH